MARKKKANQTKLIHEATLALAGAKGWHHLTLRDIAHKSKITENVLKEHYASVWDITLDILKTLEKDVRADVQDRLSDNWRDNLFEILMTRFDFAQMHRDAFEKLPASMAQAPKSAARLAVHFPKTMAHMLDDAGVPETQCRPLQVAALGAIYVTLVETWMRDDTPDLAKTMAALDQRLEYFEKLQGFKLAV